MSFIEILIIHIATDLVINLASSKKLIEWYLHSLQQNCCNKSNFLIPLKVNQTWAFSSRTQWICSNFHFYQLRPICAVFNWIWSDAKKLTKINNCKLPPGQNTSSMVSINKSWYHNELSWGSSIYFELNPSGFPQNCFQLASMSNPDLSTYVMFGSNVIHTKLFFARKFVIKYKDSKCKAWSNQTWLKS